jgi:hypothetical protein
MATLYIAEYANLAETVRGAPPVAQAPAIAHQTVAITAGTLQSAAFDASTRFIRVHTDAICSIKIDSNPTATTSTARLAADQTEYFGVTAGHKVAVIANT